MRNFDFRVIAPDDVQQERLAEFITKQIGIELHGQEFQVYSLPARPMTQSADTRTQALDALKRGGAGNDAAQAYAQIAMSDALYAVASALAQLRFP